MTKINANIPYNNESLSIHTGALSGKRKISPHGPMAYSLYLVQIALGQIQGVISFNRDVPLDRLLKVLGSGTCRMNSRKWRI